MTPSSTRHNPTSITSIWRPVAGMPYNEPVWVPTTRKMPQTLSFLAVRLEKDVLTVPHRLIVHALWPLGFPEIADVGESGPVPLEVRGEERAPLRDLRHPVCGDYGEGLRLLLGACALGRAEYRDVGVLHQSHRHNSTIGRTASRDSKAASASPTDSSG